VKRLRPLDALLVGLVVPIWGAWFLFQVYAEFANRTAWVPVNVAAARSATDYPIVTWVNPYWAGRGGLAVGDMLIRAGDEQFRGIGYLGFQARVREAAGESFRVPVTIERAGERREIVLDVGWRTSTFRRLWMIFTVLASGITGIVILLKAQ